MKYIVDCSTGSTRAAPLDAAEQAARDADAAAAVVTAAAHAETRRGRETALASLRTRAANDDTVAALLKVLGL